MIKRALSSLLFLCLFLGQQAYAQVTFDAKTSLFTDVTNTPLTFSFTVGTISNAALVVPVMFGGAALPAGLAATYNGASMTQITGTNTGTNGGCSCAGVIFAILLGNNTSASHTVSISWTGAVEAHAGAVSFSGVDQTSIAVAFPHGTFVVQNTVAASPATGPVTSAANNMVVAMATLQCCSWGTISGTTIANAPITGPQLIEAANYTAGAATVNPSLGFTGGTTPWSFIATDILASAGGGGGAAPTRALMGVGK